MARLSRKAFEEIPELKRSSPRLTYALLFTAGCLVLLQHKTY
jgi:hypothetical protein